MEVTDDEMKEVAEILKTDGLDVQEDAVESPSAHETVENKEILKKQNFTRLAEPRVNKLISGLVSLGKLSNRSSYSYSDEQVDKMFDAIQQTLDDTKKKFHPQKEKSGGFTF